MKKTWLIPIALTTLTPIVSMVGCGNDTIVVLDQWNLIWDYDHCAISCGIEINRSLNFRAVIDTKELGIDEKGFDGASLIAKSSLNFDYLFPIKIKHFYIGSLELLEKDDYVKGETDYYFFIDHQHEYPVFVHEIKDGDVLVIDFNIEKDMGYFCMGNFEIEFSQKPETK